MSNKIGSLGSATHRPPLRSTKNLVRFAHNWNNGMLESWNDGFKENRSQSAYYCIDFLVLMA